MKKLKEILALKKALALLSIPCACLVLAACHTQQSVQGDNNSGNNSTSQGVNAPDASIPVSVLGGQSSTKGRAAADNGQNVSPK